MNWALWDASAAAWVVAVWLYMGRWYRIIHHVRLRWWAIPLAHGAVMFARRLPGRFEVSDD